MNSNIPMTLGFCLALFHLPASAASPAWSPGPLVDEVWVDDDYTPSTPGWQVTHFDVIQDAIDAVSSGATVNVMPGTYLEHVVIGKPLILSGSDPTVTMIDGGQTAPVVTLSADGVVVRGLHVSNAGLDATSAGIRIAGNNGVVSRSRVSGCGQAIRVDGGFAFNGVVGNMLEGNGTGILLAGNSHDNLVSENHISGSTTYDVLSESSARNRFLGNTLESPSYYGIQVYKSPDAEISGNRITAHVKGVHLDQSGNAVIVDNDISTNHYDAVELYASDGALIAHNVIEDNFLAGVSLQSSDHCTLSENNIARNQVAIVLSSAIGTTIADNLLFANGIGMGGAGLQYWNSHLITGNLLDGRAIHYFVGQHAGLVVPANAGQVLLVDCSNVLISGEDIHHASTGVIIGYSTGVQISDNTIRDNTSQGVQVVSSDGITISGNLLMRNQRGLTLSGSGHEIAGNTLVDHTDFGISLSGTDASVTGNYLSRNAAGGIYLSHLTGTTVSDNHISLSNDVGQGLAIWMRYADDNIISGNTILNSQFGVSMNYSRSNTCSGNLIAGHAQDGLRLHEYYCDDNLVEGNVILGNARGVSIADYSVSNTFKGNTLAGNDIGIWVDGSGCNQNHFVHNDLVNDQNAWDASANDWDDGWPSGGNYWDDYSGVDANGDGLGDTPSLIPGGSNRDNYPLMEAAGPNRLWADGYTLDAGTGGVRSFVLDAGSPNGQRPYLLLASLSGTAPGTPLPAGQVLPLNWDILTTAVVAQPFGPVFSSFAGVLDAVGQGSAQLVTGPLPLSAVGLRIYFAYALANPWGEPSHAIVIEIVRTLPD